MSIHKTVLLHETIDGLNLNQDSKVLDATFGGGGHSLEICKKYKGANVFAFDQDSGAFKRAKSKFKNLDCNITFINKNFRDLDTESSLKDVDGIIFDLGLSSDQLTPEPGLKGRGFSFLRDEPLLMTMKEDPSKEDLTAKEIVNTWSEQSLADIIYGYGEEKFAKRIAKKIVEERENMEIKTTFDLVKIIESAVPTFYKKGKIHFATRTFQALRIAVNDELRSLEMGLGKGFEVLKKGGRMAVISFHSLEDRIVKNFNKEKVKEGRASLINKKVILPSREEVKNNPRSRSAKLRIVEKIN